MNLKKFENLLRLAYCSVAQTTDWPEQSLAKIAEDCVKRSNNGKAAAAVHWLASYREYLTLLSPETRDWLGFPNPTDIKMFGEICGDRDK
jgi:hypothetical protein